jgi:UDP-GlcNAc:undecaprenyl-phosphate GlcNAc-1-phosphate transferase
MLIPLPLILLLLLGLSFGLCLLLTPVVRALATRLGLEDRPDKRRKMHARPIPVAGGLAVVASCITVLAVVLIVPNPLRDHLWENEKNLVGLVLGTLAICAVGVADDYRCLRGRYKVLGQIGAVAVVIGFGVVVRTIHVFGFQLELGVFAVPFTAFWLLGAINSLNLIDGMDGLLSSVGVIVSLAMAVLAGMHGHWTAACVAVVLAGALLGFLRYNFPPATIFLGDSGSMVVGLVVGVLAIQSSFKAPATVALAAPTALLIIPIFDTVAAIIRRKLTGRSLYSTDRGHLHHCLLRSGLSNRRVLLVVSSLCVLTVVGVLASMAYKQESLALLSAIAVVLILVVSRLFGFAELQLLVKRFSTLFHSFLVTPAAHEVQVRLQGSANWQELWGRLTVVAEQLRLRSVRLDVNAPAIHEGYHARWESRLSSLEDGLWRAEIPLSARGHLAGRLEIAGFRDEGAVWLKVAKMAALGEEIENVVSSLTAEREASPLIGSTGSLTARAREVQTVTS